ncbi:MAG: UDP-N-acetylmuramoyl-L-alanyl-D-glutamate--2,6-diaminopimelate ligase [Anaerolineae bacterium]|jgi:UDP-N-acetylmuramoyl-L-alanyl-D-glutamate--2,6-diaminopimelate ligase|nr:UDP-N-acetylmuramoyl-L-alanyl-D-glutamate--2,6-diaminopimelate ligase [Anaerolineae bacterium]
MRFSELLPLIPGVLGRTDVDTDVISVTADSRRVVAGSIFVAIPGLTRDGHDFIPQALASGAAAIVGERQPVDLSLPPETPYGLVANAAQAFGWLKSGLLGFPSRKMTLIGVTGTDGKTTTTNLIHMILLAAGHNAGMISTVNAQIGARTLDTGLHTTTPPADEIQEYLAEMVAGDSSHAVVEATSHGLAQHRLAGCDFDVAVVTNITHEHLDYHGTWEAYREAKAGLFRGLYSSYRKPDAPKISVLNADDHGSYDYLRHIPADWQVVYGLDVEEADVTAVDICHTPAGLQFMVLSPWGQVEINSNLVGAFNISNILAAVTTGLALEVAPERVAAGIAAFKGVPGRMERIDAGQDFTAIVDFAHTPNALRRALEAARGLVPEQGRVIVAFGCAGLRDREKRRLMGEVAAAGADITVITAEDPRTESLDAIVAETAHALELGGKVEGRDFFRVSDRGKALLHAVSLARPGDLVMACGKGHEQSMCFGEVEYPWDDREAIRKALQGDFLATLPTAGI